MRTSKYRHRRAVDEPHPDSLSRFEEACPVAGWRDAVHQIRVGVPGHVGEVRRAHPHFAPHLATGECLLEALRANVPEEVPDCPLIEVVVIRALLQFRKHARRILVGPVGEHHDVFAVVLEGRRLPRLDDERTIQPALFLESRMTVVPVRAGLPHFEAIHVGLTWANAVEAETRDSVHVRGQENAVPMNGRVLVERVRHTQRDRVALFPAKKWRGNGAVHRDCDPGVAGEVHRRFADS